MKEGLIRNIVKIFHCYFQNNKFQSISDWFVRKTTKNSVNDLLISRLKCTGIEAEPIELNSNMAAAQIVDGC